MVADQLSETAERLREVEAQLAAARQLGEAAADRAQATQFAVAVALNAAFGTHRRRYPQSQPEPHRRGAVRLNRPFQFTTSAQSPPASANVDYC